MHVLQLRPCMTSSFLLGYVCPVELALMKRIIIQGAMNHASGAEMTKLLATTAGSLAIFLTVSRFLCLGTCLVLAI
jgi:hypothetical protein